MLWTSREGAKDPASAQDIVERGESQGELQGVSHLIPNYVYENKERICQTAMSRGTVKSYAQNQQRHL